MKATSDSLSPARVSLTVISLHLVAWIFFLLAPVVISPTPWSELTTESIISLLVRTGTLAVLFYVNLFYLAPVFRRRTSLTTYLFVLALGVVLVSSFNAGFHQYYAEHRPMDFPGPPPEDGRTPGHQRFGDGPPDAFRNNPDGHHRPRRPMMLASPSFASLLMTILAATVSSLLVWREEWMKAQREQQEQALARTSAELTALKLQVSPHFLFNTLNNIRWLVRSKSDNAEDAVVKLSHLLRYMLYQTNEPLVELSLEIRHLIDFIDLQRMRLTDQQSLVVQMPAEVGSVKIVPLLLLPLVENMFKHGDFTSGYRNSLQLSLNENRLTFKTENKIGAQEPGHGIGLKNVERRLALHYPSGYSIKYFEEANVFHVELHLTLTHDQTPLPGN